jgi:organic hydroperoxide reductase OsmC/OhrA
MSEHRIMLQWRRNTPEFELRTYSRDHDVTFKNGRTLGMSSAPAYRGNPDAVDPEEMLVASLSSCHMLTFLAIAAAGGVIVDAYEDQAIGHLEKNSDGKLAITRVTLRPKITFPQGKVPHSKALMEMHQRAHEDCFIANSVKSEVTIEAYETQHA